jgi:NodT family efflux transporter outer membrane factor (OMF) lipoprotein
MLLFNTRFFATVLLALLLPGLAHAALPPWWWVGKGKALAEPLPVAGPEANAVKETWISLPNNEPTSAMQPLWEPSDVWPTATWWTPFGDTQLDALMRLALAQNPSLREAEHRMQQAQQSIALVRAERLPEVTIGANYNLQRFSKNQFPVNLGGGGGGINNVGRSGRTNHFYTIPLQASYDVDLWGRYRDKHEAAKRVAAMAKHDYHNYLLQLTGTVAQTYWQWAEAQALVASQTNVVALLTQATAHAAYQTTAGLAPKAQQLQQDQALDRAKQQLAQWQRNEATARIALAPLLGLTPAALDAQGLLANAGPPVLERVALPSLVPTGVPGQLVAHRPDVQARWQALEEVALTIRATEKEVLPAITLTGQFGYNAIGASQLFDWGSLASGLGASVLQPVFTGGRTKAALAIAEQTRRQVAQAYVATLQQAYAEAETSLATLNTAYEVAQQAQRVHQQALALSGEAEQQWRYGLASEVTWLPQQVLAEQAYQQQLQATTGVLLSYVGVCRALGGGF